MYLFTLVAVALLSTALSQSSAEATCSEADLDWTFNVKGTSPCEIAGTLAGVCSSEWSVGPVMMGQAYSPSETPDDCQCNTVTYSLLSACSACQGGSWLDWNTFSQNCSSVFIATFPKPLPNGLGVPAWAYNNVQFTSNTFDPEAAQLLAASPESSALPSATQPIPPVLSTRTATETTVFTTPTSTRSPAHFETPTSPDTSFVFQTTEVTASTSAAPSESSSVPAGAIAVDSSGSGISAGAVVGGILGGLAALFLILCLLVYFLRRRLRQATPITDDYMSDIGEKSDKAEMPNTIEKPLACQSLGGFYDTCDRSIISSPETTTVHSNTGHYVPYSKTPAARQSLRHSHSLTHHRMLRGMTNSPVPTENPFENPVEDPFNDPESCIPEIEEKRRHDTRRHDMDELEYVTRRQGEE